MRVLSNIAGGVVAFVDQAAGSWLARTGGGEPRGHEVAILRRLTRFRIVRRQLERRIAFWHPSVRATA